MSDRSQQFDTNASTTTASTPPYREHGNGIRQLEQTVASATSHSASWPISNDLSDGQNDTSRLASAPRPTPSAAIISFVFGVLGICFTLPIVGSIIAIISGCMARREIRQAKGQLGGERLALAGLIMGVVSLGLALLIGAILLLIWIIRAAQG